jgi:hypothetical protein
MHRGRTTAKKIKARPNTSRRAASAKLAPSGTVDLSEIRRQITDMVANGAVNMVETTMAEVGKGHYLGMKYLFEMIGLYPSTATDDVPMQESLAATLLRRLGLPEASIPEPEVTKDSASPAAVIGDSLE